jgi:hypothetical protein
LWPPDAEDGGGVSKTWASDSNHPK